MKNRIKNILGKSFVQNVLVMITGTAGAQAVVLVLSPLITRLYGPEAYGVMGTFNSIINIVAPVAALTYPIAIVLPKSDKNAIGLIRLSLIITGILSLISLVIILLLNDKIVVILNLKEVSTYLFLIPLVIIFAGLMQVAEQWLIRTKQFYINARVTFLNSIIINGSKVGIGLFYPFASVLVLLTVLSNGLRASMMIFFARKFRYKENVLTDEKKKSPKALAKQYYDFPLYRAPEAFLNAISNGLPVIILTSFFGASAAGFYTIGRSVLSLPSQLVGKAVGDVFYPRIAEAAKEGENVTALIKKATLALGGVGILPFGLIILFGPSLFSFVFGAEWHVAGEYARWIALWSLFGFMNRPSVHALPVLNAQRFHLIYTIIMLFMRFGALSIGYIVFSSDIIAVALFGITGAILNVGLISITLKISKKKNRINRDL